MFAKAISGAVVGIDAELIEVQCDIALGLPSFAIVGLPQKEVQESRERIRSALKNAGFDFPAKRITVNLAPADLPKEGVGLDLLGFGYFGCYRADPPRSPRGVLNLRGAVARRRGAPR